MRGTFLACVLLAGLAMPAPVRAQRALSDTAICAHRGWLAADELENSLGQIARTVAAGTAWVEIDLGTSRDGTLYLLHDRTLDRTTTAKGPLRAKTDDELAAVRLRTAERASDEPLPRFTQLVDWARTRRVSIMVDLKDGDPAKAASILRQANMIDRALFLSFDAETDAKAFASDPSVRVSVLVKDEASVDAAIASAKGHPLALYVPHDASASVFQRAARAGVPVITDAMDSLDVRAPSAGPGVYRAFLQDHPVTILVTNRPRETASAVSPR